jgi:hypothetical protein
MGASAASDDLRRFVEGVEAHLAPVAAREGFSAPIWIPRNEGETLCAMRAEPFHLLVYLASGHGINMTVCAAPRFADAWNPEREVGLTWLCRSLALPDWDGGRRFVSYDARDLHLRDLAARLPAIVAASKARGPSLWPDVQALVEREIPRPRSWKDLLLAFWRRS